MATSKDEKLDPEHWDENGMARPGKNVYSGGYNPTTRFHPNELPANPIARANFPDALIDENAWTQSPMSDAPMDMRMARAKLSHDQEKEKLDRLQEEMDRTHSMATERVTDSVPDPGEAVQASEDTKAENLV